MAAQDPPPPVEPAVAYMVGKGAVADLYATLCASCHAANLEGDRSSSLLDDLWTFGADDGSLAESIREGRPSAGMPPFKAALSDRQIASLVVFIREQAGAARQQALPTPTVEIGRVFESERQAFKLETVIDGLETPWGLEFLPDGRLIFTEREGRLRIATLGQPLGAEVTGLPKPWVLQDGGLMDLTLHPDYARNGWIYLGYSEAGGLMGASETVIVRGRVRGSQWVDQEVLFRAPPELYWEDNTHFGLRFLFDRQGNLFYSIGDRGHRDDAQSLASPHGKVHRIRDDGKVPDDNPFVGRPEAVASIWSYGNRNVQGMAWHPVTGALFATEHGPRGGDELNHIEKGKNYGWPAVTFGINYDGTPVSDKTEAPGMEPPLLQWTPSIGVCGIAFYTGDQFPGWKNDLFATGLVGKQLVRITLDGDRVAHREILFKGSRVRDVAQGPDGYLYVALNNPGRIVRLVPVRGE